jgi:hypothetical protein
MTIVEDISSGASGLFSGLLQGTSTIAIVLVIIAVAFIGLIVIIQLRRRFDFEGSGSPIGHYSINIMGKYSLEGNLAEWEMIDDEELDLLKQEEQLKVVPDVLKQMYKEKTLFIYTMKKPDDSDIMDKFGNRVYIISSGNLKSDIYSWENQKGKFTWRSLLTKERTRNVVAYSSARKVQVLNEDRNLDDWWIISPLPMVDEKQVIGFNNRAIGGMSHHIEIKEITNAKALASALDFAPFVTNALLKNEHLRNELDEITRQLEKTTKNLHESNQKFQKKKRQLGQKEYVVSGRVESLQKENQNVMMSLIAVILGAMAVMFIPDFFPKLATQTAQFVGMIIAIIIIGGLSFIQNKNKEKENKVIEDE